jgi:hypothetical protein
MKIQSASPIRIPADASLVERWWLGVRGQTFRQLPLETAFSLPIPVLQDNDLSLAAFYFGVKRGSGPGKGTALPPLARLRASFPEGRLLVFLHRKSQELFPGLPVSGELGSLTQAKTSPEERMKMRKALFAAYDKIMELYSQNSGTSAERKEFEKAFVEVAEPALLLYYRALNPHFFEWLEKKEE